MKRKIFSYVLTLIVIIASTGVVVTSHYCKNQLKSTALFVDARPCHGPKAKIACPMHADSSSQSKGEERDCCDDKADLIKSEIEQIHFADYIDLNELQEWSVLAYCHLNPDEPNHNTGVQYYKNYKPPLIVCDLQKQLQTFLC